MPGIPRAAPWFFAAALVVAADRLTKWAALAWLRPGEPLEVTGFFNLVLVFNRGAAFSFLANQPGWQTPFFVAVALLASGIVSWMLWRDPARRLLCSGLALILGGALGNLWDRLAYGHVVDFLDFHAMGWHWPAFNVADSALSVGAAILIAESFLQRETPRGRGADAD
jgi:signal peptidase II